jgi:hypothetical protein
VQLFHQTKDIDDTFRGVGDTVSEFDLPQDFVVLAAIRG